MIEVQGQKVSVRVPTVKEFRELQEKFGDKEAEGELHLIAACLVGEDGKPVFSAEQIDGWPLPDYLRILPVVRKAAFGGQDEAKKD